MSAPLPFGFGIAIDPDTRKVDDRTLIGGTPLRALRLSAAGVRAWRDLQDGAVRTASGGVLARRLTDIGAAHPRPSSTELDLTVVVPVRDRVDELDRCLAALGPRRAVLVVDDGSIDATAVAAVVESHGARLVRRDASGGPGAARNSGLALSDSPFVAFVDSDCTPPPDWITRLAGHFADPLVGAVAPRIVPAGVATSAQRYALARSSLDLGSHAARVAAGGRVAYVPTAAMLVRRAALSSLTERGGPVFDPGLRFGEDVDLVWRLNSAGWRVRYDPSVRVPHAEPASWPGLLARRFRYGTSAAPLAARHPEALHPLVLQPGPAATVAALLARRPLIALGAFALYATDLTRRSRRAGLSRPTALRSAAGALVQTWLGTARYVRQFALPAVLLAASLGGRRSLGRRIAIATLIASPAVAVPRAPSSAGARLVGCLADDVAYGAGVWRGALSHRTVRPLVPKVVRRSLRLARTIPEPVTIEGPQS